MSIVYHYKKHIASKIQSSMKSLMIIVIFAITLILLLMVNMSQARTHPSKMSLSSQSLSDREGSKSIHDPVVGASLRRIPPSKPNPTQNKLKPRIKG
ncbi:hypothetical protein Lal_00019338 [Lupinus albus]|uniref:Uncharacterized protein n=1 Tax=Lupinus albus TaxID=3870 RepID=A0A6A4R482_LUPAL|nr:hypothetical protein Lalb_Chr01g0007581 [Lupinus albus]KAF1899214.1 hypothetical protein Lal_00019338 [Lupinus albus]